MHTRKWPSVVVIVLALAMAGCAKDDSGPTGPAPEPGPFANSPVNALLRLRWAWASRDLAAAQGLFTDDFVFVFSATDSAGNSYRDHAWVRENELACNQHLFVGGGSEPPATSITLNFDQVLRDTPDPRPGKGTAWHRAIHTSVALTVRTENQAYECQGRALFYFVRGDSASIPPDLIARGVRPDSTRWWIERWEDQTVGAEAWSESVLRPLPAGNSSWGKLKALYLASSATSR